MAQPVDLGLFASHCLFSFGSSSFSSVSNSTGSVRSSSSFSSGSFCAFFGHRGRFVRNRFGISSHRVSHVAGFVGGFTASSKAQSRSGDSGGKNDLTHDGYSLYNEFITRRPISQSAQGPNGTSALTIKVETERRRRKSIEAIWPQSCLNSATFLPALRTPCQSTYRASSSPASNAA